MKIMLKKYLLNFKIKKGSVKEQTTIVKTLKCKCDNESIFSHTTVKHWANFFKAIYCYQRAAVLAVDGINNY